jgi:hypothetical protein
MIPLDWLPVRREDDGELVGYLLADDDAFLPMSLLGQPLGAATSADRAADILSAEGLRALDGTWLCLLPDPMPPGNVDASDPGPEWAWRGVLVVEASPTACRVRLAFAEPKEERAHAFLPVPVGRLLRRP